MRTWLILAGAVVLSAQGFGPMKTTVKLQRKRPPDVYIANPAIRVRVESQDAAGAALAQPLAALLRKELCRLDPRLHIDEKNPGTTIHAVITGLKTDEQSLERKSTERTKVDEKRVWNGKDMRYEMEPEYSTVEVAKKYRIVAGTISADLRITEGARVLHSGSISEDVRREYAEGAPEEGKLQAALAEAAVRRMLPLMVPTTETVELQLPNGKLAEATKLAQAGSWQRMLDMLEKMPAFPVPAEEAYRRYSLGVASEALAYRAEEPGAARKLAEEAAAHYGAASERKPDEKYFRDQQARVRSVIARMERARERKEEAFTNQTVMDLVRSGLDEAILLDMIREAPNVSFDLGPQGVMKLLENKVSNKAIAAMRARAAATR